MNAFIFFALCLMLFLLPLPYGSVEDGAVFAFEAATLVLFALHLINTLKKTEKPEPADPRSKTSLVLSALLALFFFVVALQLVPLPAAWVRTISPRAFDIAAHDLAAGGAGASSPGFLTLSLAPALTARELVLYVSYALFAFLVYRHAGSRRRVETLVLVCLGAGLFQAVYGLAEFWGGTGRIFGWVNIHNQGSAFGTFVNRDHYAGFLEMIFPLSLGYLLAKADFSPAKPGLSLKEKILWLGRERRQKTLLYGLIPVVLGLGLVFSRCRTGIFILLVSLFLMSAVLSATAGQGGPDRAFRDLKRSSRSARIVRTVALAVVFLAAAAGLDPVISRFTGDKVTLKDGRPVYFSNSIDLVTLFPLAGSGAGTFVHAYPMVEKAESSGLLRHAHNDYLETLADTGPAAGGALIAAAFLAAAALFSRWLERRDRLVRGLGLGALAGITALLIHGFFDYNLRIPANAAFFLTLFALAWRIVRLPSRHKSSVPSSK